MNNYYDKFGNSLSFYENYHKRGRYGERISMYDKHGNEIFNNDGYCQHSYIITEYDFLDKPRLYDIFIPCKKHINNTKNKIKIESYIVKEFAKNRSIAAVLFTGSFLYAKKFRDIDIVIFYMLREGGNENEVASDVTGGFKKIEIKIMEKLKIPIDCFYFQHPLFSDVKPYYVGRLCYKKYGIKCDNCNDRNKRFGLCQSSGKFNLAQNKYYKYYNLREKELSHIKKARRVKPIIVSFKK
jgi:hypothetical protein